MDNNIQDPDDPAAIWEVGKMVEEELLVEKCGPDQLSLEDVLKDEVAEQTYHLNRGALITEAKVDPGYNLLPAPVPNIEELWGKKGPLRGFLTKKKDKRTVSAWVNLDDMTLLTSGLFLMENMPLNEA